MNKNGLLRSNVFRGIMDEQNDDLNQKTNKISCFVCVCV